MNTLEEEFAVYQSLAALSRQAKDRALSMPHGDYVTNLNIIGLTEKRANRRGCIEEHFDRIDRALFDQFLVRLVAMFERCMFERLATAIGNARSTLQESYDASLPFSRAVQHLVKDADDLSNLAGIEKLLASYPRAAVKDLEELRLHRNYIAHGGRVGRQSRFRTVSEVYEALRELLHVVTSE